MRDVTTYPDPARKRHLEMLAASCAVVALAFLLQVQPNQRVAFRGLSRFPLPPLCSSRAWFGVKCPGCGLTRAIVHLAHADWSASLETHRLGWLMAVVIVLQIPYRILALRNEGRPPLGPIASTIFGSLLIALLIGNWALEMVARL